MLKYQPIFFVLILLVASTVFGDIISSYSVESSTIKNLSLKVDPETLVLVNIDDTLVRPSSKMFLPSNPYHNFIDVMIAASKQRPFFNKPIQNWFIQRKLVLVEPNWSDFIKQLQDKGAQVWGLTQMDYKIYDLIDKPEEWRHNELTNLTINFTEKLGDLPILKLSIDPLKQPIFYKGIIFTAKANKSETILDLLKTGNLRPKKIVVFDSNLTELKLMQRALRKFDIDFYGINYLAVAEMRTKVNADQIKLQQDTLIYEGKWLEDEEALKLLQSKSSAN